MRKGVVYCLRVFILAGLLVIAAGIAWWAYPALAMAAVAAVRGGECSASDALRGSIQHYREARIRAELEKSLHLKRTESGMQLWSTRHGEYWFPEGSAAIPAVIIAQQASDLYAVAKASPNVVLDIGAHVGTFSRAALLAGAKLVVAVEPTPENLRCLRRNLADEIASGRVVVIEKGA